MESYSVVGLLGQELNVLILMMCEINTLLLILLKMYLVMSKHRKSLILLKKLVSVSNFNVFILMFVIFFFILA